MNDIYLVKRESNRGCWVLSLAAALILLLAWFVFFRDHRPDDNPTAQHDPAQHDPIPMAPEIPPNDTVAPDPSAPIAYEPGRMKVRRPGATRPPPAATATQRTQATQVTPPPSGSPQRRLTERVNPAAKTSLARGRDAMVAGNWDQARKYGFEALNGATSTRGRLDAESFLSDLHTKLAFSKASMAEKTTYKVKYRDTLGEIAKEYNTTVPMLMRINNKSNANSIRLGENLHIIDGTWKAEVDISERSLRLFLNDKFFKRYSVGIGKPGHETPTGSYHIQEKVKNPAWYPDAGTKIPFGDPRNELGTRWMGWDLDSFGIHGTNKPESIGQNSSAGCVRMHNAEVEELYDILSRNSEVVVKP